MRRSTIIGLVFCCVLAALCVNRAGSSVASERDNPSNHDQNSDQNSKQSLLTDKIRALGSTNPIERASAACQIGEMGKSAAAAIPALIQMLADDTQISDAIDCGERNSWRGKNGLHESTTPGRIAAQSLAAIGEQSVEPLLAVVRADNPIVRVNAVFSLGIIQDPRTVEPVIAASRDADPRVREQAVWGLGLKQDKSVIEPLIAALADREWKVREKAGWSLGLQGDSRSVEPLTNAL